MLKHKLIQTESLVKGRVFTLSFFFRKFSPEWTAFGICLLILLSRSWTRIHNQELWAEDGTLYLYHALRDLWGSLFFIESGYMQLIQRAIVTAGVQFLPFAWIPSYISVVCVFITAAVFATIVCRSFSWLCPSTTARFLFAVSLCFSPGLAEMLGNAANLYPILTLWFGLIALKEGSFSWVEVILCGLVGASIGIGFLFIPLFLIRVYEKWEPPHVKGQSFRFLNHLTDRETRKEWVIILILVLLAMGSGLSILKGSTQSITYSPTNPLNPSEYLASFFTYAFYLIFLQPGLGKILTYSLIREAWWLGLIPALLLLSGLLFKLKSQVNSRARILKLAKLLSFEFVILLIPVITWMVRPGSIELFSPDRLDLQFWTYRYIFLPTVTGALLWMVWIRRPALLFFYFMVLFLGLLYDFEWKVQYPQDCRSTWAWDSHILEQSYRFKVPKEVTIPICPTGWWLRYSR